MTKPTQNRPPNAGRPHPSDSNRTIINARGKNQTTTTTVVQQGGGSGSSTSVTVTSPLQMAGNVVSIPQATGSVSGYLLAADWSTFNAKMTNPMTTTGDLILGGSGGTPTRIGIGSNTYVLTSNGTTASWQPSSGGGSSPYTIPLLADFTVANAPAGSTRSDTVTGLAMYTATTGLVLHAMEDLTAPAGTFTLTAGFRVSSLTANSAIGVYVQDGTGKIAVFGIDTAGNASGGNASYFTNYTTFSANPFNVNSYNAATFARVIYDGVNFYLWTGTDINALMLVYTVSATVFIAAPAKVGIFEFGFTQDITGIFFHYLLV